MNTATRTTKSKCIFHRESSTDAPGGEILIPTPLAQGPWHADSLHGSPMIGALARAIERFPSERPMQVTRLTVDMLRAAPMRPLQVDVRARKRGKSVEFLDASLSAEGEVFATASAMRFRTAKIELPSEMPELGAPPPHPRVETSLFDPLSGPAGAEAEAFHHSLELRPVPGFETPTVWVRFCVPFVMGEENTPLVRVAVTSDFAYSIPVMRRAIANPDRSLHEDFSAINPDTNLHLHRPLVGEWACLASHVIYDGIGAGTVSAAVFDDLGPVGHVSQSVLVRGADKVPEAMRKPPAERR